jgi:hypothetical protein
MHCSKMGVTGKHEQVEKFVGCFFGASVATRTWRLQAKEDKHILKVGKQCSQIVFLRCMLQCWKLHHLCTTAVCPQSVVLYKGRKHTLYAKPSFTAYN